MQSIKYRIEGFDDYFPCTKIKCKLKHVIKWFELIIDYPNKEMTYKVNSVRNYNCELLEANIMRQMPVKCPSNARQMPVKCPSNARQMPVKCPSNTVKAQWSTI